MGKATSIIQQSQECFLCGGIATDTHHIIHGSANRRLSDEYGLTVRLCRKCHDKIHRNAALDFELKKFAQQKFEARYPEGAFLRIFGVNYLGRDFRPKSRDFAY